MQQLIYILSNINYYLYKVIIQIVILECEWTFQNIIVSNKMS